MKEIHEKTTRDIPQSSAEELEPTVQPENTEETHQVSFNCTA